MSCQRSHIPGFLKIAYCASEKACECGACYTEKSSHSPSSEQNDISKSVSAKGHQTTTLENENDSLHNLERMCEILNQDTLCSETHGSSNSELPHNTTIAPSSRKCSIETSRHSDSARDPELLKLLIKTSGPAVSSTSASHTENEILTSNVLKSESLAGHEVSVINEDTLPTSTNTESFEKYPCISVDKQNGSLDVSSLPPISRKEKHETFMPQPPNRFRTLKGDLKPMKVPLRNSSQLEFRLEGEKVERKTSRLPNQPSVVPKGRSSCFENPTKREKTPNQFTSQSISSYKRNTPHAFKKCPSQQTKSHRASNALTEPPFDDRTKNSDTRHSLTRYSASYSFGSYRSAIPCQEVNNAAHHANTLTTKLHALGESHNNQGYHRAEYPRELLPGAKRCVQRASAVSPFRSGYVNSMRIQYPRSGTPEALRFNLSRTLESHSLGASYFNSRGYGTRFPRGRASEIHNSPRTSGLSVTRLGNTQIRYQSANSEAVGIVQNQLNALHFHPRSYSSIVASDINVDATYMKGRIFETKFYQLDPSLIPLLPEVTFERICREGIICEHYGYYYIIFKLNNESTHRQKREYHIRYIISQNLDGTCNFSSDDNGVPTRGEKRDDSLRLPLEVIEEWLRSLPRPEDMDKIR